MQLSEYYIGSYWPTYLITAEELTKYYQNSQQKSNTLLYQDQNNKTDHMCRQQNGNSGEVMILPSIWLDDSLWKHIYDQQYAQVKS